MVTAAEDPIDVSDLPPHVRRVNANPGTALAGSAETTLRKRLQKMQSELLKGPLAGYKTQAQAAKYPGVTQSTVARKAKRYGLEGRS